MPCKIPGFHFIPCGFALDALIVEIPGSNIMSQLPFFRWCVLDFCSPTFSGPTDDAKILSRRAGKNIIPFFVLKCGKEV